MQYTDWQTFRTTNGNARITYHPDWDSNQPWASYINGTAGRHFATPEDAKLYFRSKGMNLDLTPKAA